MKLSAACAFVVGTVALDIVRAVERSNKTTKKNGVHPAPPATPVSSMLAVQDGRVCSIIETDTMGTYTLRATLANETVVFLERPERGAATVPTKAFVESFDVLFKSSPPNVAMTFAGASLDGPLIVVLSQPRVLAEGSSTLDVEYTMEQSESQTTVAAIEQFLNASGSCSLLIDSLTNGVKNSLTNGEKDLTNDEKDLTKGEKDATTQLQNGLLLNPLNGLESLGDSGLGALLDLF